MRHAAIVVLMLLATTPAFGDQSAPNPRATALLGALRKAEQANPYGKLFQAQQLLQQAVADKVKESRPTVVCGMVIIPADPSIDPKMRVTPPQDPNVEYKIRTIDPPVCNPAK
jgi:hypothetical protein